MGEDGPWAGASVSHWHISSYIQGWQLLVILFQLSPFMGFIFFTLVFKEFPHFLLLHQNKDHHGFCLFIARCMIVVGYLSFWAGECMLVCLKILDTSVYFNEICSVDTQTNWFVCQKPCLLCRKSWLLCQTFYTQEFFVLMQIQKYTSVCFTSAHPCFHFRIITWVNANGFSPNLVCALILWRSGLGLLMGQFHQFRQNYLPVTW